MTDLATDAPPLTALVTGAASGIGNVRRPLASTHGEQVNSALVGFLRR